MEETSVLLEQKNTSARDEYVVKRDLTPSRFTRLCPTDRIEFDRIGPIAATDLVESIAMETNSINLNWMIKFDRVQSNRIESDRILWKSPNPGFLDRWMLRALDSWIPGSLDSWNDGFLDS